MGGKARKDVLDTLRGLNLADPTFFVEEAGGTAAAGAQVRCARCSPLAAQRTSPTCTTNFLA